MKSSVLKRSVVINGHKTSISLENPFWDGLKMIARDQNMSLSKLLDDIDKQSARGNLSSTIRIFVFQHFKDRHQ